jgi:methylenetetrahydrofolate reductase (NADPH)
VHPEAPSPEADLANLGRKVAAGAEFLITQLFLNNEHYFRFVSRARAAGIAVPIVPGIMPIGNFAQLARFSDACGAEIPRWVRMRLQSFGDDTQSIKAFGLDVVTALCERLRAGGAPCFHFYTMNQAAATVEICRRLAA